MSTEVGGDVIAELSRISIFQKLEREDLEHLAPLARRRSVPSESVLFFEGDQSDSLYMILSGSAKVYQTTEDGQEKILKVVRSGEIVGEFALLEGLPRSATVETLEPTEALVLERRRVQEYMLAHPQALWKVAVSLCARVRELGQETIDLSYREVPYRLLRKLGELAERNGERTDQGIRIVHVTLRDLASMVGTNRETVRRYLNRFADEKLLVIDDQELYVPDLQTLKRSLEYVSDWY